MTFENILPLIKTYGRFLLIVSFSLSVLYGQQDSTLNHLDIDFSKRKKVFVSTAVSGYLTLSSGLYFAWYKDYEQGSFHSFNDWREWQQMDKLGHSFSAYNQSMVMHGVARWAGYKERTALHIAALTSIVGQLTIEVMDGFTEEWGFSYGDMGFNFLGTGLYYLQERSWSEQPLKMKMSYWPETYPASLQLRADDLFGTGTQKLLKDYNAQTYWLSIDPNFLFPESNWPAWLDIAIGYGVENVYGGFENSWMEGVELMTLDEVTYPRTRKFLISLDYDLTATGTRSPFLKSVFGALNMFKWPAPAIEYNKQEGFVFHLVFRN